MLPEPGSLTSERRQMLAAKGRRLYGKFCGTGGRGICAESFAVYHIGRGEEIVAEDLIDYLEERLAELAEHDPYRRFNSTLGLIERIRKHLTDGVVIGVYPEPQPAEECPVS